MEGGQHVVVEGGLTELLAAGEKKQSASERLPALIAALDDASRLNLMVRMGKGLSVDDAVAELEAGEFFYSTALTFVCVRILLTI